MTDREMLELAAKAAGMPTHTDGVGFVMAHHPSWNPLADDGDAFRLAVKLGMCVTSFPKTADSMVGYRITENGSENGSGYNIVEGWENDPNAATRRAIVRAAVDIAENMEEV